LVQLRLDLWSVFSSRLALALALALPFALDSFEEEQLVLVLQLFHEHDVLTILMPERLV
jgi:hypothetical protein